MFRIWLCYSLKTIHGELRIQFSGRNEAKNSVRLCSSNLVATDRDRYSILEFAEIPLGIGICADRLDPRMKSLTHFVTQLVVLGTRTDQLSYAICGNSAN